MTEKLLIRVNYDYYTNSLKFLKVLKVDTEYTYTDKYYCREIGEGFKIRDNKRVKEYTGNCYSGLRVFKCIEIREENKKYKSNLINSTQWELVEDIKEYLREKIEEMDNNVEIVKY